MKPRNWLWERHFESMVGVLPAGSHQVDWDGRDLRGAPVRPGVYLYRIEAGVNRAQRRIVILP